MRRALVTVLALLAAPVGAQQADRAPRIAPPPPPYPREARAEGVKTVDIPQAAKDAGHNGRATFTVTVGADGSMIALVLKESSMSPAIDAAAKAQAERLRYFPATDKDGNRVEGTVNVSIAYARYDSRSPGGGIETYTCGDLVREWDWFTAANAGRRKLFWPMNAYTSLTSVQAMQQGITPSPESRQMVRAQREKMWAKLIKRCRKQTARLMLEEVDRPQIYANLVNSF